MNNDTNTKHIKGTLSLAHSDKFLYKNSVTNIIFQMIKTITRNKTYLCLFQEGTLLFLVYFRLKYFVILLFY